MPSNGLNNVSHMAHTLLNKGDIDAYFKLYILLFVYEAVIFAESAKEL